jgi:hypothetical protein
MEEGPASKYLLCLPSRMGLACSIELMIVNFLVHCIRPEQIAFTCNVS